MRPKIAIVACLACLVTWTGSAASETPTRSVAFELGYGGVAGLLTNAEYERSNPGILGTLAFEQTLGSKSPWTLGAELNIGSELAADDERGGFGYVLGGGRIAYRGLGGLGVWGALRFGVGGYTSGQAISGTGVGLDYIAFGHVGVGLGASVYLLSPGYDPILEEDLDAAAVGTFSLRVVGKFSM